MNKKKETKKRKPRAKRAKPAEESVEEKGKPLPVYDGAQVLEVIQENTPEGWHHCRMSDGTTKHVPVELF